jgi:IMP dehydrogenase
MTNTAYTYSDVLIKPAYSEILSRSTGVDLATKIGELDLRLPVISSNMKTITGPKMAAAIAMHGGLGLLHRFCTIEENVKMYCETIKLVTHNRHVFDSRSDEIENAERYSRIGVSIGVKDEDKDRFDNLYGAGARVFCIDVAHGHHILVKNMLKWINENVRGDRDQMTLIAGNIATPDAYNALSDWGADAAKVGIGPSPVCRTRYNTGVGVPQLYALETIFKESMTHADPISIIADGGISHVGDIAKALKYADAVMLGSMLAGTSETPGSAFRNEQGDWYKVYGGSASGENKGANRFVEGVVKTVKFNGEVKYIIREIEQGLQSTFSYVGASNHNEFQEYCEFLHISGGAHGESKV